MKKTVFCVCLGVWACVCVCVPREKWSIIGVASQYILCKTWAAFQKKNQNLKSNMVDVVWRSSTALLHETLDDFLWSMEPQILLSAKESRRRGKIKNFANAEVIPRLRSDWDTILWHETSHSYLNTLQWGWILPQRVNQNSSTVV